MARARSLDEATLIERYFLRRPVGAPRSPRTRADVLLGIGDDAAVTRLARGRDLVTATDTLQEGVHFPRNTPPRALGHRALAVNLSDLAAMGATPLWATLALSLPTARAAWLAEFARGFFALADATNIALIGGDTVRGPLGMSVTVHGSVRPGRFVARSGARAGDALYVTGHPGDAVAGRLLLASSARRPDVETLRRRFLYPTPRLREGGALVGIASAMLDVSDGLHVDAGKLLAASGCGAELAIESLPLSAALLRCAGNARGVVQALNGGDDYELLFTVPAAREARLRRAARSWSCPVTRLGTVTRRKGVRWRLDGRPFEVADLSFRHFA